MSVGREVDRVAGWASRVLHGLRGPSESTLHELGPYFDLPPERFFPEPPPLRHVKRHDGFLSRALRTTTLSWPSLHEPLSPAYAEKHRREYDSNLTAYARWIRPDRGARREALVYVHGWLEPGSWVEETLVFPRWAKELSADIVHVSLPFHGPRNPRHALFSGEYFWTADLVRSLEGVRQAIFDVRSIVSFLRADGYERVGVSGVSLGGALAMILACLTPLPDYVIPIVAHLRLYEAVEHASIMWRMKKDLEKWGADEAERRRIFRRLRIDEYRPKLPPERQLWIEAREDGHIDPKLVLEQWRAWNQPNLHWIPGGHMTFPLHLPEITRTMARFMDELA